MPKFRYCNKCFLIQIPQGRRPCIHCQAPPEIAWGTNGNYIFLEGTQDFAKNEGEEDEDGKWTQNVYRPRLRTHLRF